MVRGRDSPHSRPRWRIQFIFWHIWCQKRQDRCVFCWKMVFDVWHKSYCYDLILTLPFGAIIILTESCTVSVVTSHLSENVHKQGFKKLDTAPVFVLIRAGRIDVVLSGVAGWHFTLLRRPKLKAEKTVDRLSTFALYLHTRTLNNGIWLLNRLHVAPLFTNCSCSSSNFGLVGVRIHVIA